MSTIKKWMMQNRPLDEIYVMCGTSGASVSNALFSMDGVTGWTGAGKYLGNSINKAYYKNKNIYLTGGASGSAISANGKLYKAENTPSFALAIATNGNGVWVADNLASGIRYSLDNRVTWNIASQTLLGTVYAIVWDGTYFIAAGQIKDNLHTIMRSTDGVNWTGLGKPIDSRVNALWASSNLLIATGSGSVTKRLCWSTDHGSTWTNLQSDLFLIGNAIDYSPINDTFVVGASKGTGTLENTLVYSIGGVSGWTGLGITIFGTDCYGVYWGKDKFIAGGQGTNVVAYSYDGVNNWTPITGTGLTSGYQGCYAKVRLNEVLDPSYWFIGDSITWGQGVTIPGVQGWTYLVSKNKTAYCRNLGVPGYVSAQVLSTSMYLVPAKNENKYIFLMIGVNDIRNGAPTYTPEIFRTNLIGILNYFISVGYDNTNIILTTVPYLSNYGSGNNTIHLQYNQVVSDLWISYNLTIRPDVYTYMVNNGAGTLLNADGVHPNIAGHAAISSYIISLMT